MNKLSKKPTNRQVQDSGLVSEEGNDYSLDDLLDEKLPKKDEVVTPSSPKQDVQEDVSTPPVDGTSLDLPPVEAPKPVAAPAPVQGRMVNVPAAAPVAVPVPVPTPSAVEGVTPQIRYKNVASTLNAAITIPPGYYPGSQIIIAHPSTGAHVPFTVPNNTVPGSTIQVAFKENVKKEEHFIQIKVPRGNNTNRKTPLQVEVKLVDGRVMKIGIPPKVQAGTILDVVVPKL